MRKAIQAEKQTGDAEAAQQRITRNRLISCVPGKKEAFGKRFVACWRLF